MRIRGRVFSWKRLVLYALGAVGVLFVLIQFVPYGRNHTNPPVTKEPAWDSPQTRAFAVGACFDCHSNETKWPWYTNIAPFSWLTQSDVESGRQTLNFSEWDKAQDTSISDIVETVNGGSMPPWYYSWMPNHPGAKLSSSEKAAFIRGLQATFSASPPIGAVEASQACDTDGVSEAGQLAALARIHELLVREALDYWLFGGWAVDFHGGSITREHDDIDIAVWEPDRPRIARLLARANTAPSG